MTTREIKFWYACVRCLPKTLIYFCALSVIGYATSVIGYATSGKYDKTIIPELLGMEAIQRYRDDHHI